MSSAIDHRKNNFKGKANFSAQEVSRSRDHDAVWCLGGHLPFWPEISSRSMVHIPSEMKLIMSSSEGEENKSKSRSESKRSVQLTLRRQGVFLTARQREESIAKRRNFQPVEDELESEDEAEVPGGSLAETLPAMLQAIHSDNTDAQLDATMKFRK